MEHEIFRAIYGGDSRGALTWTMFVLTAIGSGWTSLLILPLFLRRDLRRFALYFAVTLLGAAAVVDAIRYTVGRVRPWIALGLRPVLAMPTNPSFPSGHAAGSFAVATFLSIILVGRRLPRAAAWAVFLFTLAAGISLSRVYLGAHWPTDVIGGALIGAAVGAVGAKLFLRAPAPGRDA